MSHADHKYVFEVFAELGQDDQGPRSSTLPPTSLAPDRGGVLEEEFILQGPSW